MTTWYTPAPDEAVTFTDDLRSILEQRTEYGQGEKPDWQEVLGELEEGHSGLDLGDSMSSPLVRNILAIGRRLYREMREAND